jgi:S-DNA-T family DNA segregation ATPase FtsK/SpoIIIE
MVTSSKFKAMVSKPVPRSTRSARATGRRIVFPERLTLAARHVMATLGNLAGSPRLRRESLGICLVVIAFLTAWVLGRGGDEGRLIAWWGEAIVNSCGRAAPLVPILIVLVALRSLAFHEGPVLEARHYLGGFIFSLAIVGLLQLGAGLERSRVGGYLGIAVGTLAYRFLGELGAGLALFVAGVIAVFLLAGSDLQTFWDDLRALVTLIANGCRHVLTAIMTVARLAWKVGRRLVVGSSRATESSSTQHLDDASTPVPAAAMVLSQSAEAPEATPAAPPRLVINIPPRAVPPTAPKPGIKPPRDTDVATGSLPLPAVDRLTYYDGVAPDTTELQAKARRIEATLASFKVEATVREINPGPAVTQFALEPGLGIKVRRITELQNDLALALAAPSIRIEAPVPGMARVGLEIPNEQIATVGLRETLEAPAFARGKAKLPIPLGRDVHGRYVVGDLTRMPHLLIAGATGSGKSVCLNGIISTFLLTRTPADLKLLMIDPKMVELTGYNGVPHLQCPVVTEMDKVVGALRLTLREMERRYTLFSRLGVRNLDGYRMKVADETGAENLPYLVVIIDELADLMMTAPDEVETLLVRLAQMARATGIHLIIATQRPSVDVLTGLIKANVPARIAFAVSSLTDSRVVLDMPGAERLLGRGDMLFLPPDAAKPQRIQGAFIDDKDAQYVVEHWHGVAPVPHYAQEWLDLPGNGGGDGEDGGDDPLMEQALEIVRQQGSASASMLQRRLRVGYNRAARLIEHMEDEGVIGAADGLRGRPLLTVED